MCMPMTARRHPRVARSQHARSADHSRWNLLRAPSGWRPEDSELSVKVRGLLCQLGTGSCLSVQRTEGCRSFADFPSAFVVSLPSSPLHVPGVSANVAVSLTNLATIVPQGGVLGRRGVRFGKWRSACAAKRALASRPTRSSVDVPTFESRGQ